MLKTSPQQNYTRSALSGADFHNLQAARLRLQTLTLPVGNLSGSLSHGHPSLHSASEPCLPKLNPQSSKAFRLSADPSQVRRTAAKAREVAHTQLPPLAKGMSRHRVPRGTAPRMLSRALSRQVSQHIAYCRHPQQDHHAISIGRHILRDNSWPRALFNAIVQHENDYMVQAEFATLVARFQDELGTMPDGFEFNFHDCDTNFEGRVHLAEWEVYAARIEKTFGVNRCLQAAWKFFGRRYIEPRQKCKSIWMVQGYSLNASLQLLSACSRQDSESLHDLVSRALEQQADPNAALLDPRYHGYTPLIFLAMAHSTLPGEQIAASIDALIEAGADVHRESEEMPFGKLIPLRFAASFQNQGALETLLKYVNIGDRFDFAAGEHIETIMIEELQQLVGTRTTMQVQGLSHYNTQASLLMLMYASPLQGGKLYPEGAQKLIAGEWQEGNLPRGARADPNTPGLDGTTALLEVVKKGDVETVRVLLAMRASPLQQDSEGATPLHFAAIGSNEQMVRALLEAKAHPDTVDNSGFSPWMLVGESVDPNTPRGTGERELIKVRTAKEVIFNLLQPPMSPEDILAMASECLEELVDEETTDLEILASRLRLHESLFFAPRAISRFTAQGRAPRHQLLARFADVIVELLNSESLSGNRKIFAKYLLHSTMGPSCSAHANHVCVPWSVEDNRSSYRARLMVEVNRLLCGFAEECNSMRDEIEVLASNEPKSASAALCSLSEDLVTVPMSWQSDPFWHAVQTRQVLRYDPVWALRIKDGATRCLEMLRLGAVHDLAGYSSLAQVYHKRAEEIMALGYVAYSELCNERFQDRMCCIAGDIAKRYKLKIEPPKEIVAVKRMKRLTEKMRAAKEERDGWQWPNREELYLCHSHCFYILDTVRLSFVCGGTSLEEQAACCMRLFEGFRACTVEEHGICMLRYKSGFAAGVDGAGGYKDVKLLIYADLGTYEAFDGTEMPLCIIGEVQLILDGYMRVKKRMHLAYEIDRGSFDHPQTAALAKACGARAASSQSSKASPQTKPSSRLTSPLLSSI